jgi:hypothetical protein
MRIPVTENPKASDKVFFLVLKELLKFIIHNAGTVEKACFAPVNRPINLVFPACD